MCNLKGAFESETNALAFILNEAYMHGGSSDYSLFDSSGAGYIRFDNLREGWNVNFLSELCLAAMEYGYCKRHVISALVTLLDTHIVGAILIVTTQGFVSVVTYAGTMALNEDWSYYESKVR